MIKGIKEYIEENFPFLDKEAQERIIKEAINSLRKNISNLEEVLKKDDKEVILKATHNLKGVLLNAGIKADKFEEENLKNLSLDEIKEKLRKALKDLDPLKV